MESELRTIISRYGYKQIHECLNAIMRQDFDYLQTLFVSSTPSSTVEKPVSIKANKVKKEKKLPLVNEVKSVTIQAEQASLLTDMFIPTLTSDEGTKNITVEGDNKIYRDPKEVKKWQKSQEDLKHVENETAGISFTQILTKENLKKWIEEDGKTYAWVAREKAGCPETQVAATAQMMGIKSKISKKRGMIMSNY